MTTITTITTCTMRNAYNLLQCNKRNLPLHYPLISLMSHIINPLYIVNIAIDKKGSLVGYILANIGDNNIHIHSFAVDKEYRRMGVGGQLINSLNDTSKTTTLHVHCDNTGAIKFYKKLNFRVIKKLPNYYLGTPGMKTFDGFYMFRSFN